MCLNIMCCFPPLAFSVGIYLKLYLSFAVDLFKILSFVLFLFYSLFLYLAIYNHKTYLPRQLPHALSHLSLWLI